MLRGIPVQKTADRIREKWVAKQLGIPLKSLDFLEDVLRTLSLRDAKVVKLVAGVEGGREHSFEEVALMLGTTPQTIADVFSTSLQNVKDFLKIL